MSFTKNLMGNQVILHYTGVMNNTPFPTTLTTYQKVLLSDWSVMAKLIFKHSFPPQEGGYKEDLFNASANNVLSDRQIHDAVMGPYSVFFLKKIEAFTALVRLRSARYIQKEDAFSDNMSSLSKMKIDPKYLDNLSADDISKLQEDFNTLVINHNQQWEGQLFFWQISITSSLKTAGLALTEMESDEFASAEPLSALLGRYDTVNKAITDISYPLTFSDYFKLKIYLTILSALSRQQLPHTDKDIDQYMKALKKPLSEINKAEKDLNQKQQLDTSALLKPIAFAVI